MRCACIDIGSNTTRLLVAEPEGAGLRELAIERVFTAIGAAAGADGAIPAAKIAEVADVVAAQVASARRHGAESLRIVATAAVRHAPNREELAGAIARAAGMQLDVLDTADEARLAFAGAIASLPGRSDGPVAVVDVGGGSTELVVGTAADGPVWWHSLAAGSSSLTRACVRADPPSERCLAALRAEVGTAFARLTPPPAARALAVGGSATSLLLLGGDALDSAALERALAQLSSEPSDQAALRLGLHPERARVLPAGIVLLEGACELLRQALRIVPGGVREGVVIELQAGA